MRDTFGSFHPWVNLIFYVTVLAFSMFFMHPILMGEAAAAAIIYVAYLWGRKAVLPVFGIALPIFVFSGVFNPVFNHEGATILFYLSTGNPFTLESVVYGVAAGAMMAVVVLWFSSFNKVMTSDKFIYIFGRVMPAISLVISMILRFIPRLTFQIRRVSDAQRCIGRDIGSGKRIEKVKHGVKILSIVVTWALENSVETADSMKSRGYGLRGRTCFSIFRFDRRDAAALAAVLLCVGVMLYLIFSGSIYILYYPVFKMNHVTVEALAGYVIYFVMCSVPMIINLTEEAKWRYLQSRI